MVPVSGFLKRSVILSPYPAKGTESRSREWDVGAVIIGDERWYTGAKQVILDGPTPISVIKNEKRSPGNFNKLRTGKEFL